MCRRPGKCEHYWYYQIQFATEMDDSVVIYSMFLTFAFVFDAMMLLDGFQVMHFFEQGKGWERFYLIAGLGHWAVGLGLAAWLWQKRGSDRPLPEQE